MTLIDWLRWLLGELAAPSGPFRHVLEVVGDTATLAALVGTALFALSYRLFFNWRRNAAGRSLAQFTLALTSVLLLVLLARMFGPDYAFRWILRDAIFIWCAWSAAHLVFVLWRSWRRGVPTALDLKPKTKEIPIVSNTPAVPKEPTQVRFPWKATLRTALQSFLAVAAVLVLALPLVAEFVEQFWPGSPVVGFIGTAAAFVAALAALVTRIMALAPVNEFLTKIGLGATPAGKER